MFELNLHHPLRSLKQQPKHRTNKGLESEPSPGPANTSNLRNWQYFVQITKVSIMHRICHPECNVSSLTHMCSEITLPHERPTQKAFLKHSNSNYTHTHNRCCPTLFPISAKIRTQLSQYKLPTSRTTISACNTTYVPLRFKKTAISLLNYTRNAWRNLIHFWIWTMPTDT